MANFQASFAFERPRERIRFGAGAVSCLGDEVAALGASRAFLVTTEGGAARAGAVEAALGASLAEAWPGALPHGPGEATGAALAALGAAGADALVAAGGGTAIGLGKILAARTGLPLLALPTTYAGVEADPRLEETRGHAPLRQEAGRGLPSVVIYDPDLSRDLPWAVTLGTAMTALAQAVGGLCAGNRTPLTQLTAKEALWIIAFALPTLRDTPRDPDARAELLHAAWLAGMSRGAGARIDHHRLVDALSGAGAPPAAALHGVLLPCGLALAEGRAGALLDPIRDVFGDPAGEGLREFGRALGVPESLAALGLDRRDLGRAADLAAADPGGDGADRRALAGALEAALAGRLPGTAPETAARRTGTGA